MFSEQDPPSKLIRNISQQSSIPIASDPIYVDGIKKGGDILSTAIHNTCVIVNSLGGKCNQKAGKLLDDRWKLLTR